MTTEMTIHYMPSEIARLVLGYLRETNCKETEKVFIKESKHMTEYAIGLRHGINYSTNIGGKSLMDVINGFCSLQTQDNVRPVDSQTNEEMKKLSKQLTKVEIVLNKLSQDVMSSNQVLNSTPIHSNESQEKTMTKTLTKTLMPTTPSSVGVSPRRKRTPKRLPMDWSSPLRPLMTTYDDSSNQSVVNTSSDQLRDETEAQLRIDINEPLVQPEFIVGELINFEPIHDILAENINKIFNSNQGLVQTMDQSQSHVFDNDVNKQNYHNFDYQEIHINDEDVNHILANLESAPEFSTILDKITEKELQMTPFKNLLSVDSNTSSASSLNTPQVSQLRVNATNNIDVSNSVVKNLMTDLKTPEKTITLYASRSPSSTTRITPVKITPVKVIRTLMNNNSLPIILPKVSVVGEDYNRIQNSIANHSNAYSVSVQTQPKPNPLPKQCYNSSATNRRPVGKKRIDLMKLSSDVQLARRDLMPRKILPKAPNDHSPTTTVVQVSAPVVTAPDVQTVPKQSIILVNNNVNSMESNGNGIQNGFEPQKRLSEKSRNNKRPNSESNESSVVKIRATDVQFPTVNILRKMNVNHFLNQIHSKSDAK